MSRDQTGGQTYPLRVMKRRMERRWCEEKDKGTISDKGGEGNKKYLVVPPILSAKKNLSCAQTHVQFCRLFFSHFSAAVRALVFHS